MIEATPVVLCYLTNKQRERKPRENLRAGHIQALAWVPRHKQKGNTSNESIKAPKVSRTSMPVSEGLLASFISARTFLF